MQYYLTLLQESIDGQFGTSDSTISTSDCMHDSIGETPRVSLTPSSVDLRTRMLWPMPRLQLLVFIFEGILFGLIFLYIFDVYLGGTLKGRPQLADRVEMADHIHKDATDGYAPYLRGGPLRVL